ncbi:helix-turn-helix transcriptional regulator [Chryseobacterium sp. R2A-55]|uniref:helix-turn-helix transcriptional regulator n=1 Tax=Chryseobacterium sp. R2A-55 TaxID=2744445 RepID=UPI001F42399B|nr:helix-turn-helix transcriptional regulator [Chryseobacterium sp. R2A-55]
MKTKLQEIRISKGLSQEDVANLVGMTQPNYSRKENGLTKISKPEWELLTKKLDVILEDIYEEEPKTTIIDANIKGNSFNSGIINITIPDFILNYIELLQKQNEKLEQEIQRLKDFL